jgi:hypothetical protein
MGVPGSGFKVQDSKFATPPRGSWNAHLVIEWKEEFIVNGSSFIVPRTTPRIMKSLFEL